MALRLGGAFQALPIFPQEDCSRFGLFSRHCFVAALWLVQVVVRTLLSKKTIGLIEGPDNPTSQLLPIIKTQSCSVTGIDKGGGG